MSLVRSTRASFGSGRPGRLSNVLFIFVACLTPLLPTGPVIAQTAPGFPPLSFRQRLELQMLGEVSGDFAHAPSWRLSLQRRRTLRRSTSLSGMFLVDPLSQSVGLALGQVLTFPEGGTLLEPFAELGAAFSDARVPDGSYEVVGPGGIGQNVIHRYQVVRGPAALAGAGFSWAGLMGGHTAVRFTAGYWRLVGTKGFSHGSFRLGVSLGRARRDARWYALATDRTPPVTVVAGRDVATADSVEVTDGRLRVLASDTNGISRIQVNGGNVDFGPAGPTSVGRLGLGANAVVGAIEVRPRFGGEMLDVAVRDSAGVTNRSTVWAFPPPDHDPPVVTVLSPDSGADVDSQRSRALADDPAGIADAHVGLCPVDLVQLPPDTVTLQAVSVTARLVRGWGAPGDELPLDVRDRAGNSSRVSLAAVIPPIPADAAPPRLTDLTADVGEQEGGRKSVRVHGAALDPAGGWISRVTVEGRPAVLRVDRYPSRAEFGGWLLVDSGADAVTVAATTADGRTVQRSVPVTTTDPEARGRLHTLLVFPDSTNALRTSLLDLAGRAGTDDASVLVGASATPTAVLEALTRLESRVRQGDVVIVHVEGALAADPSDVGPSVELTRGRLDLGRVGRLLRELDDGATLFSTRLRPGHSWTVLPTEAPGVPPPPGCYEGDEYPAGAVVDAGPSSPGRMLTGLAGAADQDRDGRVLMTELLAYLGVSSGPGLFVFDPLLTVATPRGAR